MAKRVKRKAHTRRLRPKTVRRAHKRSYLSGKYYTLDKKGKSYILSLGNLSDAGWYWDGDKSDLASYLVRIANSTTKDKFLQDAKDNKLKYSDIKKDVLPTVESALYEVSGDNALWSFGQGIDELADAEDYISSSYDYLSIDDRNKLTDDMDYSWSFEGFASSSEGKELLSELKKIFKQATSFEDLFDELNSDDFKYDSIEKPTMYISGKIADSVDKSYKKLGLDKKY
jgi:hypothetical protein